MSKPLHHTWGLGSGTRQWGRGCSVQHRGLVGQDNNEVAHATEVLPYACNSKPAYKALLHPSLRSEGFGGSSTQVICGQARRLVLPAGHLDAGSSTELYQGA